MTHCFTPAGNGLVEDGRLIELLSRRVRRESSSTRVTDSEASTTRRPKPHSRAGFWPDTISTDLHSLSASGPVGDLATTMSKFLNLGMPLHEVIRAATSRPAEVIGRLDTIGTLRVGNVADITVLDIVDGEFQFADSSGATRTVPKRLLVDATIRAGIPWGSPLPHPGQSAFAPPPDGIPQLPGARTWP